MSMVPAELLGRRLTLADYEALPDDQDYEIIDGVLYVAPRPFYPHQGVSLLLTMELFDHAVRPGLGYVVQDADLIVNERGTYVSPDIMYFTAEQHARFDPRKKIEEVPTLVVEVLSESTMGRDQVVKRDAYARLGVPHYWIADRHGREIAELVLGPDGLYRERTVRAPEPFRPALFPDLSIDLERLFSAAG